MTDARQPNKSQLKRIKTLNIVIKFIFVHAIIKSLKFLYRVYDYFDLRSSNHVRQWPRLRVRFFFLLSSRTDLAHFQQHQFYCYWCNSLISAQKRETQIIHRPLSRYVVFFSFVSFVAWAACLEPRPIYEVCVKWLVNDRTNYYFPLCDHWAVCPFVCSLLCLLSPPIASTISDRDFTLMRNVQ